MKKSALALFILSTLPPLSLADAPHVFNEQYANPGDVRQAVSFISQLPPACDKTSAYASPDGTVNIRLLCESPDNFVDGLLEIKNGVVKKTH